MNLTGERIPFYFANPSVAAIDDARRRALSRVRARRPRRRWDIALLATTTRAGRGGATRIGDDPPCAIHMVPNLALDPTPAAASRGTTAAAAASHTPCAVRARGCQASVRINDRVRGAVDDAAGELAVGDYQALVVDNARRILHAVWTQPVLEGGKPVARIFHARAKLPLR